MAEIPIRKDNEAGKDGCQLQSSPARLTRILRQSPRTRKHENCKVLRESFGVGVLGRR
jgi:hypothetical protein